MKLDIFTHIFPRSYYDRLLNVWPQGRNIVELMYSGPALIDLDSRFRLMDRYDDYAQVICLSSPPIEAIGPPPVSTEMAKFANDAMAELVVRHGDRFPAFVASLPMNDPDGLLAEASRAIEVLGASGVQVHSNVNGRPLTAPETMPLFDLMAGCDRPIWLHPERGPEHADYLNDKRSHYEIWFVLGWPFDTTVAMAHIVFSGLFEKHPTLKVIAHQMGATIPMLEGRIGTAWNRLGTRSVDEDFAEVLARIKKTPVEYFRMFYADTALAGALAPAQCGLSFFGSDKVLFASDAPFGAENGAAYIRGAIDVVEQLEVSSAERQSIFEGNARRLLKLRMPA